MPVLISVLAAAAISAGGFGAGYGAGIVRYEVLGSPPQEQAQQEQRTSTNLKSSSAGPNVIAEDGTITWMSETWIAHGGNTVPGFEALGSSQVSAPPVQEQLPGNNQADVHETAQPQPAADNSSATAPNQQPSTQPTGSSGNAAATKDGNTTSGNTQSGVNINPSSQANTKTQTGGSNQTSNLDWPEGKFLASKNGKVYHRMYCERGMTGAVNIKEENKIWFDSEEEARAAGKERCGNCW